MMEFYNPSLPEQEIPLSESEDFATVALKMKGIISRQDQLPYVKRIYRAYLNFKGEPDKLDKGKLSFLDNRLQVKEYRQFASILAQPGLIVNRGIVFIILEITSENKVRVICPPYGFTKSMEGCDIGILLKQGDIWEPVFFYQAKPLEPETSRPKHTVTPSFSSTPLVCLQRSALAKDPHSTCGGGFKRQMCRSWISIVYRYFKTQRGMLI
jgi:hypothetical protein